jgi:hypothetical protein
MAAAIPLMSRWMLMNTGSRQREVNYPSIRESASGMRIAMAPQATFPPGLTTNSDTRTLNYRCGCIQKQF